MIYNNTQYINIYKNKFVIKFFLIVILKNLITKWYF